MKMNWLWIKWLEYFIWHTQIHSTQIQWWVLTITLIILLQCISYNFCISPLWSKIQSDHHRHNWKHSHHQQHISLFIIFMFVEHCQFVINLKTYKIDKQNIYFFFSIFHFSPFIRPPSGSHNAVQLMIVWLL